MPAAETVLDDPINKYASAKLAAIHLMDSDPYGQAARRANEEADSTRQVATAAVLSDPTLVPPELDEFVAHLRDLHMTEETVVDLVVEVVAARRGLGWTEKYPLINPGVVTVDQHELRAAVLEECLFSGTDAAAAEMIFGTNALDRFHAGLHPLDTGAVGLYDLSLAVLVTFRQADSTALLPDLATMLDSPRYQRVLDVRQGLCAALHTQPQATAEALVEAGLEQGHLAGLKTRILGIGEVAEIEATSEGRAALAYLDAQAAPSQTEELTPVTISFAPSP